jgi:hypothetical protein
MRPRLQQLLEDAISIIETCGDPDCEPWLGQAKAELAVLEAKAKLREALTRQTLPDNSWSAQAAKPKRKPASKLKHKPTNSKAPASHASAQPVTA